MTYKYKIMFVLAAFAALAALLCSPVKYDNEYDPKSPNYKPSVTVNCGTSDKDRYAIGATVPITADPPPAGHVFSHWTSDTLVTFADDSSEVTTFIMPPNDVTVTANFKDTTTIVVPPTKYDVMITGGTATGDSFAEGETVPITAKDSSGYKFVNWTSNPAVTFVDSNQGMTSFTMIGTSVTITANFEIIQPGEYNIMVTVDSGGVANADPNISPANTEITLTAQPTLGWDFVKWQVVSGGVTLADTTNDTTAFTMPDNAVEVRAVFEAITYNITYKLNDGTISTANPATYTVTTPTFTLNNPTRTGYTFTGWTGSNGTTPQTAVTVPTGSTGDKNYTANWTIISYTITFDPLGGTVEPTSGKTNANGFLESPLPPTPTKDGYAFVDWFTTATGGTAVDGFKQYLTNGTIYARWTPVTYNIEYELNGGNVAPANPTTYNIETATFQLKNPTKTDWTFIGWTEDGKTEMQTTVSIEKGSFGDKKYTANFELTCVIEKECLRDARDDKVYKIVEIGNRWWMAENLNFAGTGGNTVGVCYENSAANCATYGRLYKWVEAMNIEPSYETALWAGNAANHQGVCPVGWRVPNLADWEDLMTTAGGGDKSTAHSKLKSQTGWTRFSIEDNGSGTDDYGFSALPGGWDESSEFNGLELTGVWWSTMAPATNELNAQYWEISSSNSAGGQRWYNKTIGASVRCVQTAD